MVFAGVETEFSHRYRIEDRNRENSECGRQIASRPIWTIKQRSKN